MADRNGSEGGAAERTEGGLPDRIVLLICGVAFVVVFGGALYVLFGLHDTLMGDFSALRPAKGTWEYVAYHAVGLLLAVWGMAVTWRESSGVMRWVSIMGELAFTVWFFWDGLSELSRFVVLS